MTKWPKKSLHASWLGLLLSSSIIICYRSRKWKCVIDRFENIHPSLLAPAWSNTGERDSGACSPRKEMVLDTVETRMTKSSHRRGGDRFEFPCSVCQTHHKNLWKVLLAVSPWFGAARISLCGYLTQQHLCNFIHFHILKHRLKDKSDSALRLKYNDIP